MKTTNESYSRDELRPANTGGSIPNMGWNTNEDIGGVPDWQNVGKETGSTDPYPQGHGPVGDLISNPVRGTTGGANINLPFIDAKQSYNMKPTYHEGVSAYGSSDGFDPNNSDSNTLNTVASTENRSAKYKSPNVSQDTSQMPPEPKGEEPNI